MLQAISSVEQALSPWVSIYTFYCYSALVFFGSRLWGYIIIAGINTVLLISREMLSLLRSLASYWQTEKNTELTELLLLLPKSRALFDFIAHYVGTLLKHDLATVKHPEFGLCTELCEKWARDKNVRLRCVYFAASEWTSTIERH